MTSRIALAGATGLLLAACATQAAPPAQDPAAPHKCDPSNIQQFVGQQRSSDLERRMLEVSGASLVRWAPFGTAITMEFRADRLTVFLDENNRINRISCS